VTAKHARSSTFERTRPAVDLGIRSWAALNEISNSRLRHVVNLLLLRILLTKPPGMKTSTLAAIKSGKRLGRLLMALGEDINIYRASLVRIPPEALPLLLASRRRLDEYVEREIEKLVKGALRFDV